MKKIYIQPLVETYDTDTNTILAGTLEVHPSGTTSQQCAKSSNLDFEFDEEDEDDFLCIDTENNN